MIRLVSYAPPHSGVVGKFLEDINMFKARIMRIGGLLARINESGQRTELLLQMGAERMEAAESRLEQDLRKQGLISERERSGLDFGHFTVCGAIVRFSRFSFMGSLNLDSWVERAWPRRIIGMSVGVSPTNSL